MKLTIAFAILATLPFAPVAAGDTDWKVEWEIGSWNLMGRLDPFTDQHECIIIYKDDATTQLSRKTLAFALKGMRLKSYQFRFDDEAPNIRDVNPIEKELSVIYFEGADLEKALDSKRLRLKVETEADGSHYREFNLSRSREMLVRSSKECPDW